MQNAICFSTKFGWITATEQKNKVTSIHFKKSSKQGKTSFLLNKLKSDINLFFKGETKLINLPLKIEGNSIQKKIWNELRKIKKGKTKSYSNNMWECSSNSKIKSRIKSNKIIWPR